MNELKRFFGILIVIFAFIGGMNAITARISNTEINEGADESAAGFAAGFLQSYLTINETGLGSINAYTSLPDSRISGGGGQTTQKVLGIWPVHQELDEITKRTIVELIVKTETIAANDENRTLKEVRDWRAQVQVTKDGLNQYQVVAYPTLRPLLLEPKESVTKLNDIPEDYDTSQQLNPMLISFFKTYFASETSDDMANFFKEKSQIDPMKGTLDFMRIDTITAYGEKAPWLVFSTVRVSDPISKLEVLLTFQLEIELLNGKYYITNFKEI